MTRGMPISLIWDCRASYVFFKGQIHGIKIIPINKEDGHCPSIRLDLYYLDKKEQLQTMTLRQFKYLLKRFETEIKALGFKDYNLELGGLFIQGEMYLTQNLYAIYKELAELFSKSILLDWHRTDRKLSLKIEVWSHEQ